MSMIAIWLRSRRPFISSRIWAWIVTSRAVVGSSAMSSSGLVERAMAIMTRWRIPPESWCGYSRARRFASGIPTWPSISTARSLRLAPRDPLVERDRLRDLVAARVDRVERGHRLLEDHRDRVAADVPHLLVGHREEVAAREPDRALDDPAGPLDEPHDRERRDALAAPGLADDAQGLAVADPEADPVDGLDHAVLGEEVGPQVLDGEEIPTVGAALGHQLVSIRWRGSSASRRPSPRKLAASTTRTSVMPGYQARSGSR